MSPKSPKPPKTPSYRRHASGQAIVTLSGKSIYLGAYGSPESHVKYHRAVAEWEAAGRRILPPAADVSVAEIAAGFMRHADTYYRHPDGRPTGESVKFKQAIGVLIELYGDTNAVAFGIRELKTVRARMVGMGWARTYVNSSIARIKRIFRWAAAESMLPPVVFRDLAVVPGLKAGRCEARECESIKPVPESIVDRVLPFLSRPVAGLVRLQLLTGCRPGEILGLRPIDIDTTGAVWTAKLRSHKTAWRGHGRTLYFGPQAQDLLREFMAGRPTNKPLFSPADALAEHHEHRHAARKTPPGVGNMPGTNRVDRPERVPGDTYDNQSYNRAIARACDRAFPPPEHMTDKAEREAWRREHVFNPNQLRHTAATALAKRFGIEAARVILGHKHLMTTQIYAEIDEGKALEIVGKVG